VGHSDDNLIEQFLGALDHIKVTVCHRIKTARVDGTAHNSKIAQEIENEKINEETRTRLAAPALRQKKK